MHLGPFGCHTELSAKQAKLVQKFVPRSRVGIFRNERTRSMPVDPKLMFWCILYYLGSLRTVWLQYETRCKTGLTSAKVHATKSLPNFSQRTYRVHPIRPQTDVLVRFKLFGCILDRLVALRNSVQNGPNKCKSSCHEVVSEFFATNMPNPPHWTLNWCFGGVSYNLGAFKTVWLPYETRCKTGRTSAKVRAWSRVGIFRNEFTRSTPLDPKQMFWCVSYYFCAFWAVWLPYETRCKCAQKV